MALTQVTVMDEVANTSFGNARPFPIKELVPTTCTLTNGAELNPVDATATQVLASNTSRKLAIIQNTGSANIRVGVSGVSATTGIQVLPGSALIFSPPYIPTNAFFAIREGGTSSKALGMEAT